MKQVHPVAFIKQTTTARQILEDASEPATAPAIALAPSLLLDVNGQQLITPEAVVPIPELVFGQTLRSQSCTAEIKHVTECGAAYSRYWRGKVSVGMPSPYSRYCPIYFGIENKISPYTIKGGF